MNDQVPSPQWRSLRLFESVTEIFTTIEGIDVDFLSGEEKDRLMTGSFATLGTIVTLLWPGGPDDMKADLLILQSGEPR